MKTPIKKQKSKVMHSFGGGSTTSGSTTGLVHMLLMDLRQVDLLQDLCTGHE